MFPIQKNICPVLAIAILSILYVDCNWAPLESATKCVPERKTSLTPNCTFFYVDDALFQVSCLKPGVIRFQGEYDSIRIVCTAFYLVDFFYYGIQPTEAIEIEYSKIIEPQSNLQNITFRIEIIIRSVKELQKYYADKTVFPIDKADIATPTDADYSRSGKYVFNGMVNKSLETTFHIFFEDSANPSFLRNKKSEAFLENGKLTLPCLTSHFESEINLIPPQNSNLEFLYDSTSGFIAHTEDDDTVYHGAYKCLMTVGNATDELVLTFPSTILSDSHFGLNDLPSDFVKDMDIKFDLNIISDDFLDVRPSCQVDNQSATNSLLSKVPSLNGGYDRLVREFVFPQYINRSYTVQTVTQPEKLILLLKIDKLSNLKGERGGIAFCMSGSHYDVTDYGIPINFSQVVKFPYGVEWISLGRNESKIAIHMMLRLKSHQEKDVMYAKTNLTASCLVLNGSMVKPTIWYTERENNSYIEELIDNDARGYSYFTINLTTDITRLYCAASYVSTTHFRNVSIPLNVREGMSPVMKTKQEYIVFRLGYRNQFLKCEAEGLPIPEIFWQDKNGRNISDKASYSKSILDFEKIEYEHAGDYRCIARNELGQSVSIFTVDVEKENGYVIAIIFGSFAIVFLTAGLISFLYFQKWKAKRLQLTEEEIEEFLNGIKAETTTTGTITNNSNEYDFKHQANYCRFDERPYIKDKEIPEKNFKIQEAYVLGRGEFGMVFKALVNGKEVAVKTTKRNTEKIYLKALLSELKIMMYLGQHEHIVNLIGANTQNLKEGLLYIFVEFCSNGSLESFLQFNRHKYVHEGEVSLFGINVAIKNDDSFCYEDLVKWAKQIAEAMAFLQEKQVIHGDLAARNVLLTKNMQVKVSDFGLSRQMYNYSIYIKKNQEPLPWRWLALEALRDLTFSYESDSWSFGVLVWEIFSLAEVPYPGFSWNMNFITELENGLRMPRPKYGTELLYQNIILPCWNEMPSQRPSFSKLINQIQNLDQIPIDDESYR